MTGGGVSLPVDLGAIERAMPAPREGYTAVVSHFVRTDQRSYTGDGGQPMVVANYANAGASADPRYAVEFAVAVNFATADAVDLLNALARVVTEVMAAGYNGRASVWPPEGGALPPSVAWPFSRALCAPTGPTRLRGSFGRMAVLPSAQVPTTTVGLPAYAPVEP